MPATRPSTRPPREPVDRPVGAAHELDRVTSQVQGIDATAGAPRVESLVRRLGRFGGCADDIDVPAAPGTPPPFLIVLTHPSTCAACGCNLMRKTTVSFDPGTGSVTCVTCAGGTWPRSEDAPSIS